MDRNATRRLAEALPPGKDMETPVSFCVLVHRLPGSDPSDPPSHGFGPFTDSKEAGRFMKLSKDGCDAAVIDIFLVIDMTDGDPDAELAAVIAPLSRPVNKDKLN